MATKKSSRNKKKSKARSRRPAAKKSARRKKRTRSTSKVNPGPSAAIHQGVGLAKKGRSPDTEGLSAVEDVDSESVSELEDEGQSFEAEVIEGVENAGAANQGEVKTEEVPEDDVPPEYRDYREND